MKCMINERKEIIPKEENKIWAEYQVGEGERVEGKVFERKKKEFLSR